MARCAVSDCRSSIRFTNGERLDVPLRCTATPVEMGLTRSVFRRRLSAEPSVCADAAADEHDNLRGVERFPKLRVAYLEIRLWLVPYCGSLDESWEHRRKRGLIEPTIS